MSCPDSQRLNAINIREAITKNRVISAFLVSEIHVADTVET